MWNIFDDLLFVNFSYFRNVYVFRINYIYYFVNQPGVFYKNVFILKSTNDSSVKIM